MGKQFEARQRQPLPPHDRPVRSVSQPGTRASRCARHVQSRKAIEKLLEAPRHAAHDDRPAPASAVDGETIVRLGRQSFPMRSPRPDCSCSIATGHARAERQRRAFVVISGQNWPSCSHQEQSSTRLQPRNGGNDLKLPARGPRGGPFGRGWRVGRFVAAVSGPPGASE